MTRFLSWGTVAVLVCTLLGCNRIPDDGITFADVQQSQPIVIEDFSQLTFTQPDGSDVKLADVMTGQYLVLVITRGWNNGICIYCVSQTSRWARRVDELPAFDAQLVVVFPTQSEQDAPRVSELTDRIEKDPIPNDGIPYPILLDINLTGVEQLGIRAELAKPSTYIIDRNGRVRFAYVGQSIADRPSVDSVLKQLANLNQ